MKKWLIFLTLSSQSLLSQTLEEKVGELLLVHFEGNAPNENSRRLIEEAKVGGFIYYNFSNELSSPSQVQTLSRGLQEQKRKSGSQIPLLITVDQEGGRVTRLKNGFTQFPSPALFGNLNNPLLVEKAAKYTAQELKAVGVNMNLAPVVDVNSNPLNPVIGNRAYSSDPDIVSALGESAIHGYEEESVISCLKHFPGHGDTGKDSHVDLATLDKSRGALDSLELIPFRKLAKKAPCVMTAHLLVREIDDKPATLSNPILEGILRQELGFEGVIISDSLVMKGLAPYGASYEELALKAILAGCDIVCLGGKLLNEPAQDEITVEDVIRIHAFLVDAVHSGKLPMERLDQSVKRILTLKERYLSKDTPERTLLSGESVSNEEAEALALEVIRLNQPPLSLNDKDTKKIADSIFQNECGGREEALLHWKQGEDFLSLGLGHFIWYPEGVEKNFDEGFPKFIAYLKNQGEPLPNDLLSGSCPWGSRAEFLSDNNSETKKMVTQFIKETKPLQANFLLYRLKERLSTLIASIPQEKRETLLKDLSALESDLQGVFMLVDYLNFKGDGLDARERYDGEGWGLSQVLLGMQEEKGPVKMRFITSAKKRLKARVSHSPRRSLEETWLPGWLDRLERYQKDV